MPRPPSTLEKDPVAMLSSHVLQCSTPVCFSNSSK